MALLLSSDTLYEGMVKINDFIGSGTTVFSAGTGSKSIKSINGNNTAAGTYSFVVGRGNNISSGSYGMCLNGSGSSISQSFCTILNGKSNTVSGLYATVLAGSNNSASNTRGLIGNGRLNTASSTYSTILNGFSNAATAAFAVVLNGQVNTASGQFSTVSGAANISSGAKSVTFGLSNTNAGAFSMAVGNSNTIGAIAYSFALGVSNQAVHNRAFALGNGAVTDGADRMVMAAGAGNTIKFDFQTGDLYHDGSSNAGAADFAEFFEWADGGCKKSDENRWGYGVSLTSDGRVVIGGSPIVGITSPTPGILCDSGEFNSKNKFETDEWGIRQTESFKHYNSLEAGCAIYIDSDDICYSGQPLSATLKEKYKINKPSDVPEYMEEIILNKLNPNYDLNNLHVPKRNNPAYVAIGLIGKLKIRTAEKISGNLVDISVNGLAVNGSKYHILERNKEFVNGDYGIVTILFK